MSSWLPLYARTSGSVSRAKLLDGGLGTTLENAFDISHTPLWSAKAAIEHPEALIDAHLAFLRAGAQVILTATYQCSPSTFHKAGYAADEAVETMRKCVWLADEARIRFQAESAATNTAPEKPDSGPKIALSLGPFGAGLSPAQEFDGFYPPPFGPRGYTHDNSNCNVFAKDEEGRRKEDAAIEALTQFHLERLTIFAEDKAVWDAIDFIAFETVPLLREIYAIRKAMAELEKQSVKPKPWWISCVFPNGSFPETDVPVRSVVEAAVARNPADLSITLPVPSALGINCTAVEEIPNILAEMEDVVATEFPLPEERSWLVVYPNGGDKYDPISQTWVVGDTKGFWAERIRDIVAKVQSGSCWPGVVVGGCCRTGPEDISLLGQRLET
ncbi:Hcy-binding domain-containing protein [Favolaschia claudopus]|uniref:Hcy-binding domain-containing protein n=1 Tax=Favolaschia claudopus TaxID=2862362 RepID=A0AAW0A5J5_9AGAR